MSQLIRRLLSLLFTLGFYDKHYKIKYSGEVISFNKLYSGGHWSKRSGYKNRFHKIFSVLLLEAKVQPLKEMMLVVFFRTRHDPDNIVLTAKFLLDAMKGKYITDDSTKYYKGIQIFHDESLQKGELEMHIIGK